MPVFLRENGDDRRMARRLAARRGHAVPVVGDVRVRIDQSRKTGVARKVDDLGTGRYRDVAACHALARVVFDDDHGVGDDAAVPSINLPNLMTFVAAAPDDAVAMKNRIAAGSSHAWFVSDVGQGVVREAADLDVVAERIGHVEAVLAAIAQIGDAHRFQLFSHSVAFEIGNRVADVIDHRRGLGTWRRAVAGGAFKSLVRQMMKVSGTSLAVTLYGCSPFLPKGASLRFP
jgi:hypothetical protein